MNHHREAADPRKAPAGGPWSHHSGPPPHHLSLPPQRFQYVEVPGNHYIHMNQPDHVAGITGSFLQSGTRIPARL